MPFLSQSRSESSTISSSGTHLQVRTCIMCHFVPLEHYFTNYRVYDHLIKAIICGNHKRGKVIHENLWHAAPEARSSVVLLLRIKVTFTNRASRHLDFFIQIFTCGPFTKPRHHTVYSPRRCLEGKNELDVYWFNCNFTHHLTTFSVSVMWS